MTILPTLSSMLSALLAPSGEAQLKVPLGSTGTVAAMPPYRRFSRPTYAAAVTAAQLPPRRLYYHRAAVSLASAVTFSVVHGSEGAAACIVLGNRMS